jgi:poly-gamma-glutamate capsule biosynthesis protein CapA/YwtB (metallophosphatase superfamily)
LKGESCKLESCKITFQLAIVLLILLTGCQAKPTVSLALAGDLMLGRGVNPTIDSLAYLTPELEAADLALANLESPLADAGESFHMPGMNNQAGSPATRFNLCAPPKVGSGASPGERASLLSGWGFDLLSIANNHTLDCGTYGAADTISGLEQAGITPIGPGMEPVLREVNGIQLAFLAFDDISTALNEAAALEAIRSAHDAGALVIVSIHWGMEYQGGASERQKSLAQEFAEAGATLLWGHHPHVLQPAAWIESAQGRTLVLYSLGNALFDQPGLEDTRQSALAVVSLNEDGVKSARIVPFEIDVVNSRVVEAEAEVKEKIHERLDLK